MGAGPEALSGDGGVVAYVDSSALVRAYLSDEDGHVAMRKRLETGAESFVSSALTNVELTAAVNAASRHGRVADPHATIEKLLAYQYLQMLPQIAQGDANKVWIIPADLARSMGKLAGAVAPFIATGGGTNTPPPPPPQP